MKKPLLCAALCLAVLATAPSSAEPWVLLLGHSRGGILELGYAAQHPQLVRGWNDFKLYTLKDANGQLLFKRGLPLWERAAAP